MSEGHITIETIGVLRVTGASGKDLTPAGAQPRAILAVLALSPRMTVSRRWLEALFWSDRDPQQASASLRQALTTIRRSLGRNADILMADRTDVALLAGRTRVDLIDAPARAYRSLAGGREFLEGTDLRSEGFEDWLREERARLGDLAARLQPVRPGADAPEARPSLPQAPPAVPTLYTNADPGPSASALEAFLAESISAQLSKTVTTFARAEVRLVDGRAAPVLVGAGSQCVIRVSRHNGDFVALARLTEEPSGRIYWHRQIRFDASEGEAAVDAAAALALEASEALALCQRRASAAATANAMAATALQHVFSFDPARLRQGADLLEEANALDPFAPRPALQALALAFLALERADTGAGDVTGKVSALMEKSIALDRANPLALSFLADVHDLVFQDPQTALAYARSALRSDPGLGYAYASLGGLELRRGKGPEALSAATRAHRQLANSSLEVFALMRLCVASMTLGDFKTASAAAERAASLAPQSCPPLRHLYALRLHQGDLAGARAALSALRRIEPGFSMARLREDPDFPAATLRAVGLHKLRDVEL